MKVTRKQLDELEFQLMDAAHDYGQEVLTLVMSRFYRWANIVCPGYADDWGVVYAK